MKNGKSLTLFEFIERSNKIHNNKYDYSEVDYVNNYTKIIINCLTHGKFIQKPYSHLNGNGCNKCNINNKKTDITDFINKANILFDNKYDYSLVDYKTALLKVIIICPIHGNFFKTPNKHISRCQGCPKCAVEKRNKLKRGISIKYKGKKINNQDFINEAFKIHGEKYDYSLIEYLSSKIKINIICKLHGIFKQFPDKHLSGNGCPLCGNITISKKASENPTGWANSNWIKSSKKSKYFDSFKVYIIKCFNDEEEFYKIGKTFQLIKRRFHAKKEMPYNYEVIKLIIGEAIEVTDLEAQLKRANKKHSYLPKIKFNGMYECFSSIE
jgi:hypothetical protein